ncbi:MAG TPA: DUF6470 family protein [Bacillota bacterium]|nr:DUF6470 family protein [Bacillota bacterium]HPP84772.1 DUF6470 family protein [Bacillota bacterium]
MFVYPVSLRYEITDAQLIINRIPAEIKVETVKHGYQIKNHPIKIQINNKGFFESLGIKSVDTVLKDAARRGQEAVNTYMKRRGEDKNAYLGPDGTTVWELAAQRAFPTIESRLSFIPDQKPEISWKDGYVDIEYVPDERHVEYVPARLEFEYIPYSVKIYVDKWSDEV